MTKRRKTYRVTFTDTRYMRVDLKARSARAAIKAAERLYIEGRSRRPSLRRLGW